MGACTFGHVDIARKRNGYADEEGFNQPLTEGENKMYPYHNKIKQRMRNGELETFYFSDSYPKIGECLVLVFKTEPVFRPIRPHKYHEYEDLLANYKMKEESGKQ